MIHAPIIALGYSEAAMFLRGSEGARVGAVLSIHGRHEPALDATMARHRLVLQFDDVDVPDPADSLGTYRTWVQQKWAKEIGRPLTPPTVEDARRIIEFAREIKSVEGIVVCQCQAGISRSPAAALLCLAAWTSEGQERYCVEELLRVRPSASPHLGLLMMGDVLLGREGRLVAAVRAAQLRERK